MDHPIDGNTTREEMEQTPFPPASHTLGERANWVIGVIDEPAEADRAAQAARAAGFADGDVLVFHGREALAEKEIKEEGRNPVQRAFAAVAETMTEPGAYEDAYLAEARAGHSLVNLHAAKPEEVERALDVLARHHAHLVKQFGRWTTTELKQ